MERRPFMTAVGSTGAAFLAGCLDDIGEQSDDSEATPGSSDGQADGEQSGKGNGTGEYGDPSAVVESFLLAAAETDVETARSVLHPEHPFHPNRFPDDVDFEQVLGDVRADTVESEVLVEQPTQETVSERIDGTDEVLGTDALNTGLDADRSVLIDATTEVDGEPTMELTALVVTYDEEWRLLWQSGTNTRSRSSNGTPQAFAARVVDDVRFNTDQDRARIQFVESPVADEVTVESVTAGEYTRTETPGITTYLSVGLDSSGDELLVRATVDSERRLVHREQYPPSDRIVDAIETGADRGDDGSEAAATLTLTDIERDRELQFRSARAGGSASVDATGTATSLTIDVAPEGDEVVVLLVGEDGREEIHRERLVP